MAEFIQVGICAMRDTTGKPLPAIPLYIQSGDAVSISAPIIDPHLETELTQDICKILAEKFGVYADGVSKL